MDMKEPNWTLARKSSKLKDRALILSRVRHFFDTHGYLEIETPHRIPGNAPEFHIDAMPSDGWFLQTSPEIAMKRLLAAGFDSLYQVCRVWRQEESGRFHLPEFTMLEWYRANIDYRALMPECERLLAYLVPRGKLSWHGKEIGLESPWEILTVEDSFEKYASLTLDEALRRDLFDEILVNEIEPHLGISKPTFLIEFPSTLAALARTDPDKPHLAERFELYLFGVELANAFSELNDPMEQRNRFERDESLRRAAGKPPSPIPEKFLEELVNMPPAAGIALGIDRLVMFLTDSPDIREVVAMAPDDL